MSNYNNFQEYCEHIVRERKGGHNYISKFLKPRKIAIELALEAARKQSLSQSLIERVEEKGMLDGSFELTYELAEKFVRKIEDSLEKHGKQTGKDYLGVIKRLEGHDDLRTAAYFCFNPELREKVGGDFSKLYRIVSTARTNRRRGHSLPERHKRNPISKKNFFPSHLRDLLEALPKIESREDERYQEMLGVLINKKAERDVFPVFKNNSLTALKTLEQLAENETDENIRQAYFDLYSTYQNYLDFQVIGANPNFIDPETDEKGVLPSLHQKIAIYHILNEKRFGVWDGGGTGKTAIAVLAQPLIEQELKKQGKEFRRAIVLCSNLCKKAWKKGLLGNNLERYLEEEQNAVIINGDKKEEDFIEN